MALAIKVRLGASAEDLAQAKEIFGELQADAAGALENLRDLARGIYRPLLADLGLAAALDAQAAKSPLPVTVEADEVGGSAKTPRRRCISAAGGAAEHRQICPRHPSEHVSEIS